ncbi:hypothetical protein A5714_03990 [Mycobacterium sp. E2462]|uniref:hypothetical protein n=1 Tax=Mycobacterium sp. E2462 TaxID=1834133 RepID=UPI0008001CAE|nr:hypothetical protein [Mycobacterium sp. E2462]OBI03818.1 hypothetical protein A5714_03990 [Mycobacterium sp. E2462]
MDVADLPRERGAHPGGVARSAAHEPRVRRLRPGIVHPGAARGARPVQPPPPLGDAPPDDADHRQADYFVRLLAQRRRLIDQRIDSYHRAIAAADAKGDADAAAGFRRLTRIEEQDVQALDTMIDKLHRRFARPAAPARAHVAAR